MNVLILVHPGSLQGSLAFTLGLSEAQAVREVMIHEEIRPWNGPVIVLRGMLYDEHEGSALEEALQGKNVGYLTAHPDQKQFLHAARSVISRYGLDPEYTVTGAWVDPPTGCVDSFYEVLRSLGARVRISEYAARAPEHHDFWTPDA